MLIQGKRLMPEAVSDLDDVCAPSHPPFWTLIFQVRCSGHFWILGRWSCLEQIKVAKIWFFQLHESPIGPKMLSRSREAKRYVCDDLCRGSVSMCRHEVWQWNQISSLTVYYINGALFILVLPIRGDPFNQATQKSFISLLVMYLVYSFCIWKDFFKNVQ